MLRKKYFLRGLDTIKMRTISFIAALAAVKSVVAKGPFLQQVSSSQWIIGNDIWNLTQDASYATKLQYQGSDIVGKARGHYAGVGTYVHKYLPYMTNLQFHRRRSQLSVHQRQGGNADLQLHRRRLLLISR